MVECGTKHGDEGSDVTAFFIATTGSEIIADLGPLFFIIALVCVAE